MSRRRARHVPHELVPTGVLYRSQVHVAFGRNRGLAQPDESPLIVRSVALAVARALLLILGQERGNVLDE